MKDLGSGLVLRRARAEDAEALAELNASVLSDVGDEERAAGIRAWTTDLISGRHPCFSPESFTIVEDRSSSAIISSLALISQTWTYDGIEFDVGSIDLVATHPEYRGRGLVRTQMALAHGWSAERGEMVQVVGGGFPFYRQFGYETAVEWLGGRAGGRGDEPDSTAAETEPVQLRPATREDLSYVSEVYSQGMERYLVSCARDETMWCYELDGRSDREHHRVAFRIILSPEGEAVGLLLHWPGLIGGEMKVRAFELSEDVSWSSVTPSVLRYLRSAGEQVAGSEPWSGVISLMLGTEHPAYEAVKDQLPRQIRPFAWYVRVADVPKFVRHVTPALERRLAAHLKGWTGELLLSFGTRGMRIVLEHGRLAKVEDWTPPQNHDPAPDVPDVTFPGLTFVQLLFGFRSLDDLEYAFPDTTVGSDETRELVDVLFPKRPSSVWGIQ